MGKTQLAVEFAYRYGRFFPMRPLGQRRESPDAVDAAVAGCGLRMGGLHPTFGDLTLPEQVALTERAWAGPEARLIILDNCEEPALLARWRPKGGGARVLVTSRRAVWPAEYGAAVRPLETLPRAQALALLEKYLDRHAFNLDSHRRGDTVAICAELGDLPLALHLAGSYLESYAGDPAGTPEALLAQLRDPALMLQSAALTGRGTADSPTTRTARRQRTFLLSRRRLAATTHDGGRLATALLARAACFAPGEPIPAGLLRATVDEAIDSLDVTDGLRALEGVGLLEAAGERASLDGDGEGGDVPAGTSLPAAPADRPVRRRGAGRGDGRGAGGGGGDGSLLASATEQSRGTRGVLREVEIHLRHVVDGAFDREDNQAANLCNEMGYYLDMSGDLPAARPYYERALAIRERVLGPEHPDTARSLNNLGYLLQAMGDLAAARPYYERALAIRERVLGPEHPDTAQSLNNMGALLQAMGDLPAARPYYERALAVWERVLGPEHPATALSLNNLGALLQAMGDLAAARPYYERALAVRERVLGPEHPDTAQSLNNLGYLLQAMGDLAAARPYYERALAIRERVLGPEHPDTATSLNNLGALLDMGDLAAARPYYERALAIRERVLGPEHPDTATSLNNMGVLLDSMGDLAAARPYYERALAVRERVLGPEHPDTATSLNNLGGLLQAMGDLPAARPYYERALAVRERVLGPEHPDTAISLNNLGLLLQDEGDLAGARPYYERALAIRERVLGPEHPDTASSLNNLGALLDRWATWRGAADYERALAVEPRPGASRYGERVAGAGARG